MHIGLIGGIGPAATDFYHRGLIARAARAGVSLDLTIAHADTPKLIANLAANDQEAQSDVYRQLTQRLAQAGAECVAVTSIGGHFCIERFEPISPLPVVNILSTVQAEVRARGLKRVGVLGAKTVMATGMYGKLEGVETVAPEGAALDTVHDAYVALAASGRPTQALRTVFFEAGARLVRDAGAEAVLLGGTDLNAAFEGEACGFPLVDCADIHVDALAQRL